MRPKAERMESLEARGSPSGGESKSSIRNTAEATQIARIIMDSSVIPKSGCRFSDKITLKIET